MKWFKLSGMLIPSNMIFFVESGEEDNKTWDWANGIVMVRVNKVIMELVENYIEDSDKRIFTLS